MKHLLAGIIAVLALGTPANAEVIGEAQFLLDARNAYTRETNLGNLIADLIRREADADIAIHHGGGIGESINKGEITLGDVSRALPFGHQIVVLELSGRDIKEAIEHGISRHPLPFGGFPQVSGMSFLFSSIRSPGKRLLEVTIEGEPLQLDKTYTVATNSFLFGGGYGYTMLRERAEEIKRTNILICEALIKHIRKVEEWQEPIRFAVIADPHIAIIPPGRTRQDYPYIDVGRGGKMYYESAELFLEAVKAVNAVPDLDFVLIPGDLTADSERYNHEKLLEMLLKIKAPTYVVGGNHDVYAFARKNFWTGIYTICPKADLVDYPELPLLYADYWGPGKELFYSTEVAPGVRLIGLFAFPYHYCQDERFFRWEVGETQRAWLRDELELAQRNLEFVIVMFHWPIVSHNIPVLDKEEFLLLFGLVHGFPVEDPLRVNSILEAFDVPLVLSGHIHVQDIMKRNSVWHITTGSPMTYPHVGARFFELDRQAGLLSVTTHHIECIPTHPGFAEYSRETLLEMTEEKIKRIDLPSIAEPIREAALSAIRVEPGVLFWRRPGAKESVFDDDPVGQVDNPLAAWFMERLLTVTENIAINMPEDDNAVLPVRVTGGKLRPQVEGRIRTGELPAIYLRGVDLTLGGKLSFGYLDAGRDAYRPGGRFYLDKFALKPEIAFNGISLTAELGFSGDKAWVDKFMVYFDNLPFESQIDEIRRIVELAAGWEFEVNSLVSLGLDERFAAPERKGAVPSFLETAIWEGEAARIALESEVAFLTLGISLGEGLQLGTRGIGICTGVAIGDRSGMLYDTRNAGEKDGHPEWGIEVGIRHRDFKITRFGFWGELSNDDIRKVLEKELYGYASSYRSMRRHGTRAVFARNGLTLKGESAWMRDGALDRDSWLFSVSYEIEIGQGYFHSLTPFLRYEVLEVEWTKCSNKPATWDRERFTLGVTLGIEENINLIVEHHANDETTGGTEVANDEFLKQLVFEF